MAWVGREVSLAPCVVEDLLENVEGVANGGRRSLTGQLGHPAVDVGVGDGANAHPAERGQDSPVEDLLIAGYGRWSASTLNGPAPLLSDLRESDVGLLWVEPISP